MNVFCGDNEYAKSLLSLIKIQLKTTPNLIYLKDKDLRYMIASNAVLKLANITEQELIGKTDYDILPKSIAEGCRSDDISILNGQESIIDRIELIAYKDDKTSYGRTSKYAIKDEDNNVIGIYGITYDITQEMRLEEEKERSLFAHVLFDDIFEADITLNFTTHYKGEYMRYIYNDHQKPTFEYTIETFLKSLVETQCIDDFKRIFEKKHLMHLYEAGELKFNHHTVLTMDGRNREVICMCKLYKSIITQSIKLIVCIKGISQENKFVHDNTIKPLIGIQPGSVFDEEVGKRLGRGKEEIQSLLLIAINDFKQINDSLGIHIEGEVLRLMAEVFRMIFGKDILIGRSEGDKLLVFINNVESKEVLEGALNEVRGYLAAFWREHPHTNRITYSIGISMIESEKDYDLILGEANIAMCRAKQLGRNSVCFFCEQEYEKSIKGGKQLSKIIKDIVDRYGSSLNEFAVNQADIMHTQDAFYKNLHFALRYICEYFEASNGYIQLWDNLNILEEYNANNKELSFCYGCQFSLEEQESFYQSYGDIQQILIGDIRNADIDGVIKQKFLTVGVNKALFIPIKSERLIMGIIALFNVEVGLDDLSILNIYADYITKGLKVLEEKDSVMYLQHYDALTGAYNLDTFRRKAKDIISYSKGNKYAIIYFDIAFFNDINENYGFAIGDGLLKYIAVYAKRKGVQEEILCRISGDNFCMLWKYDLEEQIQEDYTIFIRNVIQFSKNNLLDIDIEIHSGCYFIKENDSINKALDRASKAHKLAKTEHSKELFCFTDELITKLERERKIVQHFHHAIEHQEIEIYLQPQYQYSTGEIIGAEALARWNSPVIGPVFPGEFIPILEKYRLIYDLDKYIWEATCKFIRDCKNSRPSIKVPPISVNISRQDIQHENICEVLIELLEKYNLSSRVLKVELTETAYLADQEKLLQVALEFRRLGVQCQLDDFGIGYSSINTLNEIPIDVLKLDMSLVQGNGKLEQSGNVLTSVVRMAHWLDLMIIAEGVETVVQADFLKNIGCDYMQGYLFSKPVNTQIFMNMLEESSVQTRYSQTKGYGFEAKDFLNAHSFSSKLFEKIGPAAIVEYTKGNVEVLMVNDTYLEVIGCRREEYNQWITHVQDRHSEDVKRHYMRAFEHIIDTGRQAYEIEIEVPTKIGDKRWIKSQIRLISESNKSYILMILAQDVTSYYQR